MPFLREKTGAWSPEKITAFVIVSLPALWMLYRIGIWDFGARPVTEMTHFTGRWTVRFLLAALAITPARRLFNWPKLINARRTLGVAAALYIIVHFFFYIIDQKFNLATVFTEIVLRFYLTIGFVALIGFIALAITSTDAMVRRLGSRWTTLHKASYYIAIIGIVHFALQKKLDIYEPVLMMGLLIWLLAWRAMHRYWPPVDLKKLILLAVVAPLATALFEAVWYFFLTGVSAAQVLQANFFFDVAIRPAWWVFASTLAAIALSLAAQWLWPREPARRPVTSPAPTNN
jgi:sulfoxide reductase heme-binding subunit YedZ